MAIITLSEYARKHGIEQSTARHKAAKGGYKTAYKTGNIWLIDEKEKNVDRRIKTGEFIGAREKKKNKNENS